MKDKKSNLIKIGTFLDETTVIDGNIHAETNLKIDGKVNGNVDCTCDVVIGETATIVGNIVARDVVVSGCVNGNITSAETITLTSKGKIEGDIQTTGFVVDIGSHFTGNCTILEKKEEQMHKFEIRTTPRKKKEMPAEPTDDEAVASSVAASGDLLAAASPDELVDA